MKAWIIDKIQVSKIESVCFCTKPKRKGICPGIGCSVGQAGDSTENPPEKLHCIIDTTPVWKTVLAALDNLKPDGRLVINAIRKETVDDQHLKAFDYAKHLWMEKEIKSVANVTSDDVKNFLLFPKQFPCCIVEKHFPLIGIIF